MAQTSRSSPAIGGAVPTQCDEVPLLERSGARSTHPLARGIREGAPVGEAVTGSSQRTVHFTGDLLRQHHLYVAKTRMGKSTLMQHVVAHKLKAKAMGQDDDAIIVVDPHSDLVRSLLNLDSLVKTRLEEVLAS